MYKIISEFADNNPKKLKYSAAILGIAGIFLSISTPENIEAKKALAYIQTFWLVILSLVLISVFVSFIKFAWEKEKDILSVYNTSVMGSFTIFTGIVFTVVILNIWRYIISLYPEVLANFLVYIGSPITIILFLFLIEFISEKFKNRISKITYATISSFGISVLISFLGLYMQVLVFKGFGLFWFYIVMPAIFFFFFFLFFIVSFLNKNKIKA